MVWVLWEMYEEMSTWIKVSKIISFINLGYDEIKRLDKCKLNEHDQGYLKGFKNVLDGLQRLVIKNEQERLYNDSKKD